ncbi:unnamed protein product [Amoebophrya sp. A25]|nr:unnamed protein product [Amoebophrya sp. A25]|eukprot:GSA25T00027133001.1
MKSNPHDDILQSEIPEETGRRQGMLEELKTRAKGAFQSKDLGNAEMLYSKAIDCAVLIDDAPKSGLHLLYSNRAAVRLLLKKNDGAVKDCESCLALDKAFLKAHFRLAQAWMRLGKWKSGIEACRTGLELHSGNAELLSLQAEIQEAWDKDTEEKAKFNAEANEVRPDLPKPEPTRIPMATPSAASNAPKKTQEEKQSNGTSSAPPPDNGMRGYKKTADGKTTSYFHTDISDEAKKLIGDCKPQKIDAEQLKNSDQSKAKAGSAWNQAGTFEERNYTKWFHEKVREEIPKNTDVELPNDLPDIVVNVETISGDANIACTRGKVKYIHDTVVEVKWNFTTHDDKKGLGTMRLECDGDGDYDINVDVDSKTHSGVRQIVNEFVKSSSKGLQPYLLERLRSVEKKFQAIQI